jgi:hypothetical protein
MDFSKHERATEHREIKKRERSKLTPLIAPAAKQDARQPKVSIPSMHAAQFKLQEVQTAGSSNFTWITHNSRCNQRDQFETLLKKRRQRDQFMIDT